MIASMAAMSAVPESGEDASASLPGVIERLTPGLTLLYAVVLWFLVLAIAPVTPRWPELGSGLFVLMAGFLAMAAGFGVPAAMQVRFAPVAVPMGRFRTLFRIVLVLGIIGAISRVIDLTVLRGVELTFELAANRAALEATVSTPLSVIAQFGMPFAYAAPLIAWHAVRLGLMSRVGIVPVITAAIPPLVFVAVGSRSSLLFVFLTFGIASLLLVPRVRPRIVLALAAGALVLATVSSIIFAARVEQHGRSMIEAARTSAYTHQVPASQEYLDLIDAAEPGLIDPAAALSLAQYYLSGMFEFFALYEAKQDNFLYGQYQFFLFGKFWYFASGADATDFNNMMDSANPRPGVFQSFFGPAYIDFGLLMPLFAFAFGVLAGFARLAFRAGNPFALPFYVFCLMTIALAPTVSGLMAAAGVFSFVLYLGLWVAGGFMLRLRPD